MKPGLTLAAAMAALTLIAACQSGPPTAPNPRVEIYYPIELGNQSNSLDVNKTFFLGHRVERFRLRVRLLNPGRTEQWIPGVTLTFGPNQGGFQQIQDLPAGAEPDGSFWTDEFTTNWIDIRIRSSGTFADFQGGQPRLEIVEVERHFLPGVDRNDLPTASTGARRNALTLPRAQDVLAFSPGVAEAQHYRIPAATGPRSQSLYISPRSASLNNSVGLKVHISTSGFVSPDANVTWIEPVPGDTGIYTEFTRPTGQDTFVTVVPTAIAPYLIRHTWLVQQFENVVIERDGRMGAIDSTALDSNGDNVLRLNEWPLGGPSFNRLDADSDGALSAAELTADPAPDGAFAPFNVQIADYVQGPLDFDRRIREVLTIASAFALDASDGQMRFRSADLHRNIRSTRNVDLQFSVCTTPPCRGNAGFSRISMFDTHLTDPVAAGRTLHHEWGHWEYGLPDEYVDVSGPPPSNFSDAIDPNSLMGTTASTEFCTADNHLWAADAGGEEDSSWTQLADQYSGVAPATLTSSNLSHARYLDVLHKLQGLLTLTIRQGRVP